MKRPALAFLGSRARSNGARPNHVGRGFGWRAGESLVLAAVALVPYLRVPNRVTSDTKVYLFTDPIEFLGRVPYLWDRQVGAGTVSHQHVGYLFPMGPFFALAEVVGLPDWLAQRLWLASITALAGFGARWMLRRVGVDRLGAFVGAVVYMLSPYQLAFSSRMSVLLLSFAALPWIVGLTFDGVRRVGWREPAAIALLAMAAGSVNVSALVLVAVAPGIIVLCGARRRSTWIFAGRTVVLTIAASAWWLNGLRLQGRYGLPILELTENVETIGAFSSPGDLLRGLGNWFFYSRDPSGAASLSQTSAYESNRLVVAATYALPAVAFALAWWSRWSYRRCFAATVVVGIVIGAGAWPVDDPRAAGWFWQWLTERSAVFAALRNTPRVVPVVALAVAALLAAGIAAVARRYAYGARVLASGVLALAVVGFAPVLRHGVSSPPFERGPTPGYWTDLAASLEADGRETRVLEIPGANFSVFRWGNSIDALLPGLMTRPSLGHEVLPYGTAGTVDLLDAFDRRLQLGAFEPSALAPIARLFGAGTIVVRNDLDYRRAQTPQPMLVWGALAEPLDDMGLEDPVTFGDPIPASLRDDPISLRGAANIAVPPVARIDVSDARPIADVVDESGGVVVVGDGDGLVDVAAAGLFRGDEFVAQLGALDDDQLVRALGSSARIVITDSNRKRYRNFFSSIAATVGPTETAEETLEDPFGSSTRPDVFAHDGDNDQSFFEQIGGRVSASRDGGSGRPEDRPAAAFDRDPRTSWRIDGRDVVGEQLRIELDPADAVGEIRVLQANDFPRDRRITAIDLSIDDAEPIRVDLDATSFVGRGQTITLERATYQSLTLTVAATTVPPGNPDFANPVGFAEVVIGDLRIEEVLVVPDVIGRRVADPTSLPPVDIVLTRERVDPGVLGRRSPETAIARRFTTPIAQDFVVRGSMRIDATAPDVALDAALGNPVVGARARSSSRLQGAAIARAASAVDGDPSTWWTSGFRPQAGEWLQVDFAEPTTIERFSVDALADGRHQVPTRLSISIDGRAVETVELPAVDGGEEGDSVTADVVLAAPVSGRRLRLMIEAVRPAPNNPDPWLPVSLQVRGLPVNPAPSTVSAGCRSDLLTIDGEAFPIRATGADTFEACAVDLDLDAGVHTVVATRGFDSGIDIDRVVLESRVATPTDAPAERSEATGRNLNAVELLRNGRDHLEVAVESNGEPFWLVLRESLSEGWEPSGSGFDLGPRTMVGGYANGWLVTPERPGRYEIAMQWSPQRSQWLAFAVSFLALGACLALLVLARRRRIDTGSVTTPPTLDVVTNDRLIGLGWPARVGAACALTGAGAFVARPGVGLVLGLTVLAWRHRFVRWATGCAAPALVLGSRLFDRPAWVWVALGWLVVLVGAVDDDPAFAEPASDSPT